MNWQLLSPLLVTTVIAICSWFIGHGLTTRRDRANKRRDERIGYLIDAYRRLESCAQRHGSIQFATLESAIADIQLFGTPCQVELVQGFALEFAKNRTAQADDLLKDLRRELRTELGLETVPDRILHLRWYEDKNTI